MESAFAESSFEPIGSSSIFGPSGSGSGSSSAWSMWWWVGGIILAVLALAIGCHCLLPQTRHGHGADNGSPPNLHDDLQHEHEHDKQDNGPQPHDAATSVAPISGQKWCYIGDDGGQRVCGQGASCQSGAAFLTQEACLRE